MLSRGHGRDDGTRGAQRQVAQAFSRGRARAILFLVLLLVVPVIVLTSPIDTLWNTGWYDDADPDQLLTMAAEGLTGLAVLALACLVARACLESEVALRQHIPSGREPVPRDDRGHSPRVRLGSFFDLSCRRSFRPFQSIVPTSLSQSGAAMQWIAIADCIGRWAHDFAKRKKRARSG